MGRNLICPQYCPSPFCVTSCPGGALTLEAREKNIYVDTDKCNRCGICRMMCTSFSRDEVLARRRPWVSSDWVRTRA